jgi:hypothetical protein
MGAFSNVFSHVPFAVADSQGPFAKAFSHGPGFFGSFGHTVSHGLLAIESSHVQGEHETSVVSAQAGAANASGAATIAAAIAVRRTNIYFLL